MEIGTKEIANAFADLLNIRIIKGMHFKECVKVRELGIGFTTFDYKPVSAEVKSQFAKELEEFICENIKKQDSLVFAYEYGDVRPLGSVNNNMTDELSNVLEKLPELSISEVYSFPSETIMRILVTARNPNGCDTKIRLSNNILEKL